MRDRVRRDDDGHGRELRFASLGSGSHGNCTLIEFGGTCIMVDLGFTVRETERRLRALGKHPGEIAAIVVTHEHGDHIHGVGPFARKHRVPVYMSHGTWEGCRRQQIADLSLISSHLEFRVGDLDITPVPVPHDTREPCQFVVTGGGKRLGVLSDLGNVTPHVLAQYASCDALMLECNHDLQMLAEGPYPYPLKQRVGGDQGHLNNGQAAALVAQADLDRLQQLVICHVSEKNNTPELARAALEEVTSGWRGSLEVASQGAGVPWLTVE